MSEVSCAYDSVCAQCFHSGLYLHGKNGQYEMKIMLGFFL